MLWFAPLGGARGRWERGVDGRDEILIEETLGRRARREVLAHELVHVERGVGWPAATPATMQAEEERVWREALTRLAPPGQVLAFAQERASVGAVTVHDVADEFDLTPETAARVVHLLQVQGLLG